MRVHNLQKTTNGFSMRAEINGKITTRMHERSTQNRIIRLEGHRLLSLFLGEEDRRERQKLRGLEVKNIKASIFLIFLAS